MEIVATRSANAQDRMFLAESDEGLVAAAKNGEHPAYAELCRRHSSRTLRTIHRITRNVEDAEDVMQDSLMKAFAHLASFDGRSAFSTWLTRIAINTALMRLRKRRSNPEYSVEISMGTEDHRMLEIVEPSNNPEDACILNERGKTLRYALSRLSPSLKGVMEARHSEEGSVREIASTLGISEAAAKSRLLRGRAALRVTLDRLEKRPALRRITTVIRDHSAAMPPLAS